MTPTNQAVGQTPPAQNVGQACFWLPVKYAAQWMCDKLGDKTCHKVKIAAGLVNDVALPMLLGPSMRAMSGVCGLVALKVAHTYYEDGREELKHRNVTRAFVNGALALSYVAVGASFFTLALDGTYFQQFLTPNSDKGPWITPPQSQPGSLPDPKCVAQARTGGNNVDPDCKDFVRGYQSHPSRQPSQQLRR